MRYVIDHKYDISYISSEYHQLISFDIIITITIMIIIIIIKLQFHLPVPDHNHHDHHNHHHHHQITVPPSHPTCRLLRGASWPRDLATQAEDSGSGEFSFIQFSWILIHSFKKLLEPIILNSKTNFFDLIFIPEYSVNHHPNHQIQLEWSDVEFPALLERIRGAADLISDVKEVKNCFEPISGE